MSWWVKEISTITEDQSERLCIIETDTPNDLPNPVRTKPDPDNPGQTITDYTIVRGSEAYCLSNSKFYKLNSQGQWVEQTNGSGGGASSADQVSYDNTDSGLTATNIQDAIDELHDTDETQDNALVELYGENANQQLEILKNRACIITQMDIGGAKNTINATDFTSQTKNGITLTKNADDSFTITGTFTSRVTSFFTIDNIVGVEGTVLAFDGGEAGIYAYARNGNPSSWLTSSGGVPITTGVPIPAQNVGAQFDIAIMVNNADGRFDDIVFDKTVKVMICKASDYNISPAFVPYAPTNRELYETIQRQALRYENSAIIRLNQLSWSQTSSGSGMWIADCYTTQSIDTIVSVIITSFGAIKPSEIKTLFTYIPSSVSGMHTVRLVCDRDLTGISSNPTLYLRVLDTVIKQHQPECSLLIPQ